MALRLAINGFGRIGRLVVRAIFDRNEDVEIVGINDITDAKTLAHLFKYDSAHGKFSGEVTSDGEAMGVNGTRIPIYAERSPENIPWSNVDIILESTGVFRTRAALKKHMQNSGAKKVLLSAPAKEALDATIVLGVNENTLTGGEKFISNASCTTNCLAPMAKVLNDSFGIESGLMVTIHAYTNDQRILDLPHGDLRRARAAAVNVIPTTTGAAKAVGIVLPELNGKLNGYSVRVPVPDGSLTDFVAELKTEVTIDQVNAAMKRASEGAFKGLMEYSDEPLVSSDIVGNPHSVIFDSALTDVKGSQVRVVGWYDNEYGYSNRIVDLALKLADSF